MKQILFLAGATIVLAACNNTANDATSTSDSSVRTTTETTTMTSTNNSTAYTPAEGDVTYRERKLRVYRNNNWVDADADVTLDDGTIVRRNGRVVRGGEEVELEDGGVVDKTGRFFDKAGNAIENGWEGLKKGVNKAADGVEKGFNKAKGEVKDAVRDDEKKQQ